MTIRRGILVALCVLAVVACVDPPGYIGTSIANQVLGPAVPASAKKHQQREDRIYKNYDKAITDIIDEGFVDAAKVSILIEKSTHRLAALYDGVVVKEYPAVFGFGAGDKLREGDGCTPEGRFRIRGKYPHRHWTRFLWIDYPTAESWQKHLKAKRGQTIPTDSRIGGEVGIHGVPALGDPSIDFRQNWTRGCVALKNKDILELYEIAGEGTLVEIVGEGRR